MGKQNYYSVKNILSTNSDYNLLLGERSNGKSYSVKYLALWQAYHECDYNDFLQNGKMTKIDEYEFGYLRRWRDEIKSQDVERYFADMPIEKITDKEYSCVTFYRGDFYFANIDENGKVKRGKKIGSAFALTSETHYKSLSYPIISTIIFEEFLTKSGYLPHEVDNLLSIISTIARRRYVSVFMIGNTINRMCPYFDEWQLTHVKKQKIGTIEIYNQQTNQFTDNGEQIVIKIAVEYCANSGNNSKMFFGNKAKNIVSGVWDSDEFPHLEKNLNRYNIYYRLKYEYNSFSFMVLLLKDDNKNIFLYCYPAAEKSKYDRIVTDKHNIDKLSTLYLSNVTKYDSLIMELLNNNKIVFSDNLTGTEFNQIKKERGRY